jgi:tRNA-specific 2-thiouridylase
VEFFTVGQRKGLPGGADAARYVVELQAASNRVVVGAETQLLKQRLVADGALWRDPDSGDPGLVAKTRYRHTGIEVASVSHRDRQLEVELAQPDRAPAPGQALVLYRDGVVVGGGRIVSAYSD